MAGLIRRRRFEFSVERANFLTVLHRLVAPGSDRAAGKWKQDIAVAGAAPAQRQTPDYTSKVPRYRSGHRHARNSPDGDLITFHAVPRFRDPAY